MLQINYHHSYQEFKVRYKRAEQASIGLEKLISLIETHGYTNIQPIYPTLLPLDKAEGMGLLQKILAKNKSYVASARQNTATLLAESQAQRGKPFTKAELPHVQEFIFHDPDFIAKVYGTDPETPVQPEVQALLKRIIFDLIEQHLKETIIEPPVSAQIAAVRLMPPPRAISGMPPLPDDPLDEVLARAEKCTVQ